jgi:hypothetical protein
MTICAASGILFTNYNIISYFKKWPQLTRGHYPLSWYRVKIGTTKYKDNVNL